VAEDRRTDHCPRCDDSQSLHQFSEAGRVPWLCVSCGHEFKEPVRKVIASDYDALLAEVERLREGRHHLLEALETCVPVIELQDAERQRDEALQALRETIAWLDQRRDAPDWTTFGMIQEQLRAALTKGEA
jgi:ribosomal protein L37AE/L43A